MSQHVYTWIETHHAMKKDVGVFSKLNYYHEMLVCHYRKNFRRFFTNSKKIIPQCYYLSTAPIGPPGPVASREATIYTTGNDAIAIVTSECKFQNPSSCRFDTDNQNFVPMTRSDRRSTAGPFRRRWAKPFSSDRNREQWWKWWRGKERFRRIQGYARHRKRCFNH